MYKRWLVSFLCLFLAKAIFATDATDCVPVVTKVQGDHIWLTNTKEKQGAQLYFFHNTSKISIFIERVFNNPGASAGWSTYLRPDNWAALALNLKNFGLRCTKIEPGRVVALPCNEVIAVCRPKQIITLTPLKGNYWLAEDTTFESLIKTLNKKGINTNS